MNCLSLNWCTLSSLIHHFFIYFWNELQGKQSSQLKWFHKAFITHLANVHISSHQPSQNAIKTLRILKKLKKNKDIALLKPDKRNGMVILDRTMYANRIMNIISNSYKGRSHLIHFTIRTTKTKFCTQVLFNEFTANC